MRRLAVPELLPMKPQLTIFPPYQLQSPGANAVLTQTTDTTGANPGATYAVFTGLTGSSQTITCTPTGGNDQWLGISAIQIVAVPEPGTLALAAMGGVGMLAFRRRFQARR
jgi:hypothetical protein